MLPNRLRRCLVTPVYLGVALVAAAFVSAASAQDDDLESERPGLIATFSTPTATARRLVFDLSGHWGLASPDARIAADEFAGRWEGLLLIQTPGRHRFHARSDGAVEWKVGGRVVLKGTGAAVQAEPVDLPAGFVPIVLDYRHGRGEAHVALDWEGPSFGREPVPARLLYHDPARTPRPDRFEEGRRLADRFGCANCHALLDLPAHRNHGPALSEAGRAIEPAWLQAWLEDPRALRPRSRMPGFGHGFSPAEAADLRAFLESLAPRTLAITAEARMSLNVASATKGRLLFRSVGCLGCHTHGEASPEEPAAPDLSDLSRKRSREWLAGFLGPVRSGKGLQKHRHDLRLTVDEASHLAAYLAPDPDQPPATPASERPRLAGDRARGRALAERARCVSCHAIPGLEPQRADLALSAGSRPDAGCLAAQPPGPLVPRFALSDTQRQALRDLVANLPRSPAPTSRQTLAEDTIRRLNCLGCHARDGRGGEDLGGRIAALLAHDPDLGGLKGTLTPPNLTAVGDKLLPDYLAKAVRATAPTARPWLSVRMPAFGFEPEEANAIVAAFQVHDRTQRQADRPNEVPRLDAATTERAAQLIGQRGFGCISCHVLAGRIPPGGEPETLGPDLALAHQRMAERYFHRWIANPQRIIAGTPMPQFVKPVETVPGTLEDQLALIWRLLGSRSLGEVAAAGTREVLRRQGDRPLVVRDMVLVPGAPGTEYTPRALAIGLKNEHSLLFDTDRLTWLSWWHRGFLSRTKSGRLWEWHPEGEPLWLTPNRQPPIVFLDADGKIDLPREVRERFGSFTEVDFDGASLAFSYRLHGPNGAVVDVRERVEPTADGWERRVEVSGTPPGSTPALLEHPPAGSWSWTAGKARVTLQPIEPTAAANISVPDDPDARVLPMRQDGPGRHTARIKLAVVGLP